MSPEGPAGNTAGNAADPCVDDALLTRLTEGTLPSEHRAALLAHFDRCSRCARLVAELLQLSKPRAAPLLPPEEPAPGTMLGRFVTLHSLGSGAMGTVVAAYDPSLDRKVALKLPRGELQDSPEGRERLLSEARALAQLAHPNVVSVYEAGEADGHVYLAMELVPGRSLAEWLSAAPRTSQQILDVFLQAGQGLYALHRRGLVHRDFKPTNVLVGDDGRTRVTDLGLAQPHDAPSRAEGTPRYMAPEQRRGEPATAAADQYSFAVALLEALEPPRLHRSRRRLETLLARGAAARPEERFPDLAQLLAALDKSRRKPRTFGLYAASTLTVLLAFTLGAREVERRAQRCAFDRAGLAERWDDARRTALRDALLDTQAAYATQSADTALQLFDRYADRLQGARREACVATRVRGEQGEELLGRRMACLQRREQALDALVTAMLQSPRESVEKIASAAAQLPAFEPCANLSALLDVRVPPDSLESRERLAPARRTLNMAWARLQLGRPKEALEPAQQALEQARQAGSKPLLAEALWALGQAERMMSKLGPAEAHLVEALVVGEGINDATTVEGAAHALARMLDAQRRDVEAGHWAALAGAAVERLGSDSLSQARLHLTRGLLEKDPVKSFQQFETATQLMTSLPAQHPDKVHALRLLASRARLAGRLEEAVNRSRIALAAAETALGPTHPDVAESLSILGGALLQSRQTEEALHAFERASQLFERALGPESFRLAEAVHNMGAALMDAGAYEEAERWTRRAMAIKRASLPEDDPRVLSERNNLALLALLRGEATQARSELEALVGLFTASFGRKHVTVSRTLRNLAECWVRVGQPRRALPLVTEALEIDQAILPKEHFAFAYNWMGLGSAHLELKQYGPALEALERAARAAEGMGGEERGAVHFLLGRALYESGKDPARGVAEVRKALAALSDALGDAATTREKARVWLARHTS